MRSKEYGAMFRNFYDRGKMDSTYKGAFLYALTDVGHYGAKDLIGREFLQQEDGKIKMQLDFIAIRFIRYYWEIINFRIRHMPERMADVDPELDDINIIKIIKNEMKNHDKIPDLKKLASSNMEIFRKNVISKTIRNEVLNNLLTDLNGLYEKNLRQNSITFDVELVNFLKNNIDHIRRHIEIKIHEHLKNLNPNINSIQSYIRTPSPFFLYVKNYNSSLFLLGVENEMSMSNYEKTIKNKISLNESSKISVWGLRSTSDNIKIWKKIRPNDIVLFSHNNQCFSRGQVQSITQNARIAKSLWSDAQAGTLRDLLILIDHISFFQLNLKSSRTRLINPTMSEEYNFAIKQVSDERLWALFKEYPGIHSALDEISDHGTDLPDYVNVMLDRKESIVRKGQNKFRDMVLKNYHYKCAICGISEENLLESSHIIPVKHQNTAGSITNGICLCVLHHRMFDKGYLCFDSNYNLHLSNNIQSDHLKNSCTIHKILEDSCITFPSKAYLEIHRINFGFEIN